MRVVVTGGQGALGSQVMAALRATGHQAVSASRRTGVDLTTGAGLDRALDGADAVVHTADTTNPRSYAAVTVGGTRHVLEAAARQPTPPHVVTISIVGVAHHPYSYYRAKRAAEVLVEQSSQPATVVAATQFHSLAALFARLGRVGPVALGLRGMHIQPVDITWVGRRLAETAVGALPNGPARARDLSGPDRFGVAELTRLVAEHAGRKPPRVLGLPAYGATMRAFTDGTILPGPDAEIGGERFEAWLARQPTRLRGR
jgi:uncharacterized protein YbjT (DUF2867 family)